MTMSLQEIRTHVENILKHGVAKEVSVYANVEEAIGHLPAVYIEPYKADFIGDFGGRTETWTFYLFVMTSMGYSAANGQGLLDELISKKGVNSIRRALKDADDQIPGLELTITGMKGYGGTFEIARVDHVGCVLILEVVDNT